MSGTTQTLYFLVLLCFYFLFIFKCKYVSVMLYAKASGMVQTNGRDILQTHRFWHADGIISGSFVRSKEINHTSNTTP